jgi:hypothetical protein
VFVWKKELAEIENTRSPSRSRMVSLPAIGCSSTPTATAAFFGFTFRTTEVVGTRARRRSRRTRGRHVGGRRDEVDHGVAGQPPLAEHQEAQEPLLGLLPVDAPATLPHEGAHLGEDGVHRVGLEQAALDVEDRVVALRLVQPHHRLAVDLGERELHLVAVA